MARGQLYKKLVAGDSLNIADLLLETGNNNDTVHRIIIDCDPTGGVIAIALPEIANLQNAVNTEILVSNRTASTGAITITRGGLTDKINTATTTVINTAYGKAILNVGGVVTGASNWVVFNTSVIAGFAVATTQVNEQGVTDVANTFTTANPISASQHLIVCKGSAVMVIGTDYTVVLATGVITFLGGLAGDAVNIFYSHA
jgi:hypothetical protein